MSVTLKFHCVIQPLDYIEVEASLTQEISINVFINSVGDNTNLILDKSTAIKLSKELRKQIALLD